MTSLSIRGLDNRTARILKDHAQRSGKSVNRQVLELIQKGLGLTTPEGGRGARPDLDHLAGTWSDEEAKAFARRTAAFETVDKELWR